MDPLDIRRTRPAESNVKIPLRESASQTAGPYVHIGCLPSHVGIEGVYSEDLIHNGIEASSTPIIIVGRVFDGGEALCNDAMLEFWNADEVGNYKNGLWRRAGSDLENGVFRIETAMPGPVKDGSGPLLAPFINVWVTARGINIGLMTRIYFPEYQELNNADPHLALVDAERRSTLFASATDIENEYHFDIRLQGNHETVFFDT